MLFLASRSLEHDVREEERLLLLDKLQEEKLTPLIRNLRLSCYQRALLSSDDAGAMEASIAFSSRAQDHTAYVRGDIFCFEDHAFFLIFGDGQATSDKLRAGIIYESQAKEPLRKLDAFCRKVGECLTGAGNETEAGNEAGAARDEGAQGLMRWRPREAGAKLGFARFVARQDVDVLYTVVRKESARERVRAAELLSNEYTRSFLRTARVAYAEGYAARLLAASSNAPADFSIERLVEVGLLRREVLVSCRETGHALLGLPTPDALAVITVSDATCRVCGAGIADEKVEEVVAPTHLASALLDDAAWLVNRFHSLLRNLGIPESEIAIQPPAGDGEAYMMSEVCGEPFLFVLRDGDLTPAFARRAVDRQIETEASHLVVVATGTLHNEARMYLLNYATRLARSGKEIDLMILDGTGASGSELKRSFERVSQKVLAEQLCELDTSLGFSAARLMTARFELRLRQQRPLDNAAPAAAPPMALTALAAPTLRADAQQQQALTVMDFTFPDMEDEAEASDLSAAHLSREPG